MTRQSEGIGSSIHRRSPMLPAVFALSIVAFLAVFLVLPVGTVIFTAFSNGSGGLTLDHFSAFFEQTLLRESFVNSLLVAALSVFFASLISIPLAYFSVRYQLRGWILVRALGILPLTMPPFVGAFAMQLIFGRSGTVNMLLGQWFGWTLPLMDGLAGVVFVETIHYFPFILLNLTMALLNIDGAMEESALTLGSSGVRLFRRVILPLAMPGFLAGAALVFIKVFDDLGTPLVLGVPNMLAPQAFLRITSLGIDDPLGYVISFMMIAFSILALWASSRVLKGRDYGARYESGAPIQRRKLAAWQAVLCYAGIVLVLLVVLSPHIGLLLLSFATIWSYSALPDGFTLQHYAGVVSDAGGMVLNTLLYGGLAALLDVVLGTAIAYLMLRTRLVGRNWLDFLASAALAVPGVVLGIGYLRFFKDLQFPFAGIPFTQTWVIIMIVYAVRRLPYALRSCTAALQQVSVNLEEAAETLGATKSRTLRRIVIPLMAGGILAGFVTSFITAAVELSATIMLISSESQAPMSYGIYLYVQSAAGRGPGAALGVLAVAIVALGTYVSHVLLERTTARNLAKIGNEIR